jgi:hypothetical protein
MRFYFHKTNRTDFDRQVDRYWSSLPDHGGCVCEISGHRQAMPDSIREYYFKFVIEPIEFQYGDSKKDLHNYFKGAFGGFFTDPGAEDFPECFHVFGNLSVLTEEQKESFVRQVRDFAFHDLGIQTEPWRGIE